jgi:hypothetical protein
MYKLTQDVMVLTNGFHRTAGQPIGKGEIRDEALWETWVREGVVVDAPDRPLVPSASAEPEEKKAPLPHGGPSSEQDDPDADAELRKLSRDELVHMAKKMRIKSANNMKRETLIRRIEELS